jgi:MFS family permease
MRAAGHGREVRGAARARFTLLCACTFFHFLSMGVFLSGLPLFVSRELHASKAAVGFAVGSFSLTAVVSRPWVGRRIDRWGRRWFLRGAPVLVGVSAVGLVFAHEYGAVVALRLLQGLAGAAFYTAAATVATDVAPPGRRADYISRFSLFLYAGFALGPAAGEAIIEAWGYEHAWAAASIAAVAACTVAFALPETRRVDVPRPKDDVATSLGRFVHPAALAPGLVLMTLAVGYTSISSFAPLYARSIGMSSSGGLYVTFALTILAVRLLSGRLADRFGRVAVALPGLASGALGLLLVATVARPVAAFVGIAAFGAGHALVFPALMALTVDSVDERERGEALGSFTACFDLGASTGGYLVGFVADQAGYGAAWATPAFLCLAGIAVLLTRVRAQERGVVASAGELPAAVTSPVS